MEYYSGIKRNKIVSFAAIWMGLEIIILSDIILDLSFSVCLTSLSMIISRSIHVAENGIISFFYYG